MTTWYKVEGGYSLETIDEKDIVGKEVTCDEFLNEIYTKAIEIIKTWRFGVDITREEMDAAWEGTPVKSRFKGRNREGLEWGWCYDHDMSDKFRGLKVEISQMYNKKLNRYPTRDEIDFSFQSCFWDYEDDKKECKPEFLKILKGRKVIIDRCPVCGEMVYAEDPHFLDHAGEIVMHFGYGSRRDLEYGTAYIHDYCSIVLDQRLFKVRMNWCGTLGTAGRIDLEAYEKDKTWQQEKNLDFSVEGVDALVQLCDEMEFDYDNNEEYEKKKNETKDKT